jgi:hypothetical protein
MMTDFQIDPVKYGQLWEKVDQLTVKVDKLEEGMDELLELAHKGKGAFWIGMTVVSAIFTAVGYFSQGWLNK